MDKYHIPSHKIYKKQKEVYNELGLRKGKLGRYTGTLEQNLALRSMRQDWKGLSIIDRIIWKMKQVFNHH